MSFSVNVGNTPSTSETQKMSSKKNDGVELSDFEHIKFVLY